MNSTIVDLYISPDKYQMMYAGVASDVLVQARDGLSVKFPARILRPYVRHDGVQGSFVIYFDKGKRFKKIERL